jgi:hypothetical protein
MSTIWKVPCEAVYKNRVKDFKRGLSQLWERKYSQLSSLQASISPKWGRRQPALGSLRTWKGAAGKGESFTTRGIFVNVITPSYSSIKD